MKSVIKAISIILVAALTLAAMSSCIVIEKIDGDHVHDIRYRTESDGEARCTESVYGYMIEYCTICNETLNRQYTKLEDALGHSFSGNRCIRCNADGGSDGLEVIKNDGVGYTVVGIGDCIDTRLVIEAYGDEPITAIADGAFDTCTQLKSVSIGSNVKEIGAYAFSNCKNLTYIDIGCSVEVIKNNAFAACTALNNIIIPDNVRSIGDSVFIECKSLSRVVFEGDLSELGRDVFGLCYSITAIDLPEGISRINAYAFRACSNLNYVTIPSSVTSVGQMAFDGCEALREIRYRGTEDNWGLISFETALPDSIVSIIYEYNES